MNAKTEPSPLQKLLGGNIAALGLDGWDSPELSDGQAPATTAARFAQQSAEYERACTIAAPFMTPEGQKALAAIRESTVLASTFAGAEDYSALVLLPHMLVREGQNSFCRFIETCIAKAQEGPPTPPAAAATTTE